MLRGVMAATDPAAVAAIVNTADDTVLHGLHISPDIDTVIYTLAGEINTEMGWGLAGESWQTMAALERYGGQTWFRLGDRDMATHLYRTQRLAEGASLSAVTAEIARAWSLDLRVLPVTDERIETRVTVPEFGELGFQEYFVGHRHAVEVESVRIAGIEDAKPAPGVLDAIAEADVVLLCPSNPIVSIGPVLAVAGVRDAVTARRADTVAISPIIAGRALKGPADRMLTELGYEASVVGVARLYADVAATLVVDEADRDLAQTVEALGVRCIVTPAVMHGVAEATALAQVALGLP